MAFTLQAEIDLVNQALDRISAGNISLTSQSDVKGVAANLHYTRIRDSLLRSYEWNFARKRATLSIINKITLETKPEPSAWVVGDVITGVESGTTGTIVTVLSEIEYEVAYMTGDFTDGEVIASATVYGLTYNGAPLYYEDEDELLVWYDSSGESQVACNAGYPIVEASAPDFEWAYQYLLPSDYLRLIKVYEDDGTDDPEMRYHPEGNRILTNYTELNIRYVSKVTDTTLFDPLFYELFVLKLALALVNPLAGTKAADLKEEIRRDLLVVEARARCISAQESNTTGRDDFNLARYGV